MQLIVITRPDIYEGETTLVDRLFRLGMPRLHLRKPQASREELAAWIEQVDAPFRSRIVLHDHHPLARDYHLGGIHLNSRCPDVPDWARTERLTESFTKGLSECLTGGFTVSRSCHSLDEVVQHKAECDYLFLSPLFDSISKQGYGAAFAPEVIAEARQQGIIDWQVYALGGISLERLPAVREMGFGGAAVLGDLWQAKDPEERLRQWLTLL